jgi:hypothetical protein
LRDHFVELGVHKEEARPRMDEDVGDFARIESRVDGNHNAAHGGHREVRF